VIRQQRLIAPACNIQCHYCNHKYDCVNEPRPGVVSELLTPDQAVKKVMAGSHTETVLKLAKEHKVLVQFDCQDGERGHCLVRVTSVDGKDRVGGPLTEKEKTVLRQLGKITKEQIETMAVDDLPI
jgi:ferredoxin